jgi:hypothetical protein
MTGVYDLVFSVLSGDTSLQTLLGGTATDKKVYPVLSTLPASPPAIAMTVWADLSDVGHPINRTVLDLNIVSRASSDEVVAIDARVDALLNRQRFAGNGRVIHLAKRQYAHDDFNPNTQEFMRSVRYALVVQ